MAIKLMQVGNQFTTEQKKYVCDTMDERNGLDADLGDLSHVLENNKFYIKSSTGWVELKRESASGESESENSSSNSLVFFAEIETTQAGTFELLTPINDIVDAAHEGKYVMGRWSVDENDPDMGGAVIFMQCVGITPIDESGHKGEWQIVFTATMETGLPPETIEFTTSQTTWEPNG